MQQYRVNYSLLIGLIVGTLVCSGAVYGLWLFQMERKSGVLIAEAKKARAAGETHDAAQFYRQYLSIHPEDIQSRLEFANTLLDVTEQDDATIQDLRDAVQSLETMLRNPKIAEVPETNDVRRRLIGLYGRDSVGNFAAAIEHLNLMLESDPTNAELQVQRANYLAKSQNFDEAVKYSYRLIGYDPKKDKFDVKTASAPHDPQVYATLAAIVRGKQNRPELADKILDQMVEANPKSTEAYLQRGRLRSTPAWGSNLESARADAEKAYQLKPDDIDVLMFMQDLAARDEQYDKANEYLEKAKKLHPNEVRPYQAAAALEMKQYVSAKADEKQKHYDKAIAQLDEGMKKVSGSKAMELLFFKAELQIPAQDIKGARETIQELGKLHNLRPEVIDYFEARILLAEGNWFKASEALNRVRSQMAAFGRERAMEVDYSLGLCYERLGKIDLAAEKYDQVLQQDPQNEPAKAGKVRVDAMRGVASTDDRPKDGDALETLIADVRKQPKNEQDWSKVDALINKLAKERGVDETTLKLQLAQVRIMSEDYDGAAKLLAEARNLSPKNVQVQRLIIQLARVNPKIGPAKAMEILNKAVGQDQFGDLPALRLDKADILIQLNKGQEDKESLKRELANLFAGIEQWTTQQQSELWYGMAGRYLNLSMPNEARQYLALAADKQPNDLPLRLALFSLALESGDDDAMQEAQRKILEIVGDTNDSNWLYTEARRKLVLLRRGRLPKEALGEIRKLANQASEDRPEWFELQVLLAEIELMTNNPILALEHYDRAEKLGRPAPAAVAAHIKLLVANGRYNDAGKLIDRIPEAVRQLLLGPLYAEILFRSKQTGEALKQALAATESEPDNAQNFYWYGQLLARTSQANDVTPQRRKEIMADAIKAMRRAADLQPEFPDAWFALINYYAMQDDLDEAQKAMRDAQLALSGDNLQMFLARSYEVLHRWFDAETMYREIYETDPSDLGRAQQLAAFYLGPIYQRPDRKEKVAPLLNQILKAGAEKKIPANDGNLLWARRMAAKIYSSTNEYPNLLKAEKLLASNSQNGNLLMEDKLAMAEILAPRPEPLSRLKAIGLLEEVSKIQPLNDQAEIQLAELYYAVHGFSSKYENQIKLAISRFPNSAAARQTYATKLLARGDKRSLTEAVEQVNKLRALAPNSPATFDLTVRLAGKLGRQQQVRDDLLRRIPKIQDIKELDQNTAQSLAGFANLLVELGDLDSAETIYSDLAARNPAMVFDLARFLGEHREAEKCFAKLNEAYKPSNVNDVIPVALGVARARRDKIGEKYDADIQRWLDAALRENPDSIALLLNQADLYDIQKKYEEAADIYRKLLTRNDLKDFRRAQVLNNQAFLLALDTSTKSEADDLLKLVEEAADILGPNSDILDTRAVVRIAQKDYKSAIRDLELAVTDGPTASKYYHKAVAHLGDGQNKAAVEAWEKAEAMGLSRDSINRMEFEQYEDMKKKIDQIRQKKVTGAESPKRTGASALTNTP